jgi:hypothetical protein
MGLRSAIGPWDLQPFRVAVRPGRNAHDQQDAAYSEAVATAMAVTGETGSRRRRDSAVKIASAQHALGLISSAARNLLPLREIGSLRKNNTSSLRFSE